MRPHCVGASFGIACSSWRHEAADRMGNADCPHIHGVGVNFFHKVVRPAPACFSHMNRRSLWYIHLSNKDLQIDTFERTALGPSGIPEMTATRSCDSSSQPSFLPHLIAMRTLDGSSVRLAQRQCQLWLALPPDLVREFEAGALNRRAKALQCVAKALQEPQATKSSQPRCYIKAD